MMNIDEPKATPQNAFSNVERQLNLLINLSERNDEWVSVIFVFVDENTDDG